MVGAELKLEPIGGFAPRGRHHAGVVQQQVQALVAGAKPPGEVSDRGEAPEVELGKLDLGVRRNGANPCSAESPFCMSRQASTTPAPLRASSRAQIRPSPLLAPVTTAVRPRWSGICAVVHLVLKALLSG